MHVLDEVQDVYVEPCQPVHHQVELVHDLIVVEYLRRDGRVLRADLHVLAVLRQEFLVLAAVDGVEQALGKVGTRAEELHLLARLRGGDAAADAVVVAPDRLHHIVVLILDGGRRDGDAGGVLLEVFRQCRGVEHRQVRLRGRPHVLERVEEAEVIARDHVAAVHADARHLERRPDRVAGEQLIVRWDAGELHHAELQRQVVDELLRLLLRQRPLGEVAADVDVEEGGDAADAHRRAVLRLDRGQIAEVEPLDGFLGILGRRRDVVAVDLGHLLHLLQRADLLCDLLALADDIVRHDTAAAVGKVLALLLDEEIEAVERYTAVVADDAAAAVGIRQARDDVAVTRLAHLRRIGIKDGLIVGLVVFREDLVELGIHLIAVRRSGLLRHADATVRHERTLERLVRLEADHLLQILQGIIDVAGPIGGQARDDFRLTVEHAALGALLFLQLLHAAPELVGRLRRPGQEALIAIVRRVVVLDEVPDVHIVRPLRTLETSPRNVSIHSVHHGPSFLYSIRISRIIASSTSSYYVLWLDSLTKIKLTYTALHSTQ